MDIWHHTFAETQKSPGKSYIGGKPSLPAGFKVPVFAETGTEMTFFFQLELPADHLWAGHIVSVFATTDYIDDASFIPKLPVPLKKAMLDLTFFQGYQSFFRIFVFTASDVSLMESYAPKVLFHELHTSSAKPADAVSFGRFGQFPEWLLEDESPWTFEGREKSFTFLFQTECNYEYATVKHAPRQKTLDYSSSSAGLADADTSSYSLFTSNALYFFGVDNRKQLIYVVPQS